MTVGGVCGIRRGFVALSAATLLFAASAGVVAPDTSAAAGRATSTIVLIDANADMTLGKGAVKFDLQRHALAATPLPGEAQVSLATYGGVGCSRFDPVDATAGIGAALAEVKPAGRRNLVAALDAARDAFPADARRKRVLAIVGGPNQCLAALCAYADRLKAETPELVVDMIGFGLTDAVARRLDCVAANTGGRFTRADENGLATALALSLGPPSDGIERLAPPQPAAAGAPRTLPAEPPAAIAAAARAAPGASSEMLDGPELSFPTGLRLSATLADGVAPLGVGVRYELLRRGADGVLRLVARTERTASPLFAVPPGAYVARVTLGAVSRDVAATAPEFGVVNRRVALDAGQIELAAAVSGRPAVHGAGFLIEPLDRVAPAIEMNRSGQVLATLPAGRYRVTAKIGRASEIREIDVAAGKLARAVVDVPLGFLRVSAAPGLTSLRIYRNGAEVARGAPGETLFRLAPGAYRIVAGSSQGALTANAVVENGRLIAARLEGGALAESETAAVSPKPHARRLIAEQPSLRDAALRR